MANTRDWWRALPVEDQADLLEYVEGPPGPLDAGLAQRVKAAGGDLSPVAGWGRVSSPAWALVDVDFDWIRHHGAEDLDDEGDWMDPR